MSIFAKYPASQDPAHPLGTILIPLDEIGIDPEQTQARDEDYDPTEEQELEDSIEKYGLRDPLKVTETDPSWTNQLDITLIGGTHRHGRIEKLFREKGLFSAGVPCLPETYSNFGEMVESQFDDNAHEDKICIKNKKRDMIRLIGRIFKDGTYAPIGGLVWEKSIFKLPKGDPKLSDLFIEMTKYVDPNKSPRKLSPKVFTTDVRREIVDEIFNANGAPPMRQIHLFSNTKIKSMIATGKIIKGFSSQPGNIDNNKLVITMNPNDLRAKPFAVVNHLMNTLGGKNVTLTSKQNTEVIVVAYHNKATSDTTLDNFRKKVETTCSDFNDFIRHNMQLGKNVSAIDKIIIMPQKKNRSSGNEKNVKTIML
tara:strand:- start:14 stop:1114 length:1101 start_codon:yes stop_codon:yes gene_type:complete